MVNKNLILNLDDIRKLFDVIFSKIESELGSKNISIDKDYYHSISIVDIFNFDELYPDVGVGQLFDDWEFICKLLNDENKDLVVPLHMENLVSLLRYFAYKTMD